MTCLQYMLTPHSHSKSWGGKQNEALTKCVSTYIEYYVCIVTIIINGILPFIGRNSLQIKINYAVLVL